jgi:hypothetical protein
MCILYKSDQVRRSKAGSFDSCLSVPPPAAVPSASSPPEVAPPHAAPSRRRWVRTGSKLQLAEVAAGRFALGGGRTRTGFLMALCPAPWISVPPLCFRMTDYTLAGLPAAMCIHEDP